MIVHFVGSTVGIQEYTHTCLILADSYFSLYDIVRNKQIFFTYIFVEW